MTYEEFKKVVEFLDIKFVQVVINKREDYNKFKEIDLFSETPDIFEEIDDLIEGVGDKLRLVFWLDTNNSFRIELCQDLNLSPEGYEDVLFNQLVLNYDSFIKLIS